MTQCPSVTDHHLNTLMGKKTRHTIKFDDNYEDNFACNYENCFDNGPAKKTILTAIQPMTTNVAIILAFMAKKWQ